MINEPKRHTPYEDGRFDSEEDFRATLGRCLSNLHTRRGWNYKEQGTRLQIKE